MSRLAVAGLSIAIGAFSMCMYVGSGGDWTHPGVVFWGFMYAASVGLMDNSEHDLAAPLWVFLSMAIPFFSYWYWWSHAS